MYRCYNMYVFIKLTPSPSSVVSLISVTLVQSLD